MLFCNDPTAEGDVRHRHMKHPIQGHVPNHFQCQAAEQQFDIASENQKSYEVISKSRKGFFFSQQKLSFHSNINF
jgi:hypothetical protein